MLISIFDADVNDFFVVFSFLRKVSDTRSNTFFLHFSPFAAEADADTIRYRFFLSISPFTAFLRYHIAPPSVRHFFNISRQSSLTFRRYQSRLPALLRCAQIVFHCYAMMRHDAFPYFFIFRSRRVILDVISFIFTFLQCCILLFLPLRPLMPIFLLQKIMPWFSLMCQVCRRCVILVSFFIYLRAAAVLHVALK